MIYFLGRYLHTSFDSFSFLRLVEYLSSRAIGAALTAIVLTLIFTPVFIRHLHRHGWVDQRRSTGLASSFDKAGTPAMGGAIFAGCVLVSCLLWCNLRNPLVLITLISGAVFSMVGFIDDWMKVRDHDTKGLSGKLRLAVEFAVVLSLVGWFFVEKGAGTGYDLRLYIPFMSAEKYWIEMSIWAYMILASLLVVGTANATNLTDGMDGLAAGPILSAAGVLLVMAYLTGAQLGKFDVSRYLLIPKVVGATELSVVCASVVGATIGFLFYNSHPAQIFMGDTGALGLGAILGSVALLTKNELISILIFGIFFLEAMSVILQTTSFRLTGKRIFPIAPIHHSFKRMGWPEEKIVVRFWIVSLLLALIALGSIKVR